MITSEIINPAFGHILNELTKNVAAQIEESEIFSACQTLWLATDAMNKLTCCFVDGGDAVSLAIINERKNIADYIKFKTNVDPILDKDFAKW